MFTELDKLSIELLGGITLEEYLEGLDYGYITGEEVIEDLKKLLTLIQGEK